MGHSSLPEESIANESKARRKFGSALDLGFQMLPDVLVKNQARLALDPQDLVIIINLLMHWWDADELPFPRLSLIADRMGVSPRTIERRIKALEAQGLIRRLPAKRNSKDLVVREFDMSGLIKVLERLVEADPAIDFRRAAAQEKGRAKSSPFAHSDHV